MLVRRCTSVKTKVVRVTENASPSAPDERAAQLRTRLMDALEELLATRPYADIAVTDIVAQAGTSKRSFYEAYPHKGACLLDQADRFHAIAAAEVERQVLAAPDRLAGVRRGVELVLGQAHAHPLQAQAHLLETWRTGPDGRTTRTVVKRRYADVIARLAALDDGTERLELDPESAFQITGALDDVAIRVAFEGMDAATLAGVIDAAVALVRAVFVGLWVERQWGPIALDRVPPQISG